MVEIEVKVEDTSGEALLAKISAINKGYFADNFVSHFIRSSTKKDVIINRGYWSRYEVFRMLVSDFLLKSGSIKKNIISLGCGYDTLFFNIKTNPIFKNLDFKYFEMDLGEVVSNKIKKIATSNEIKNILKISDFDPKEKFLSTDNYTLFAGDLRDSDAIIKTLTEFKIDFEAPTFIFAECVLAYIESKFTDQLIQTLVNNFKIFYFLDYEMFNPNDNFGKMMVKNFEAKKCPLLGIFDYPDLASIKKRYLKMGFEKVEVYDMLTTYNQLLDTNERKRIERIEWFDEFEEWNIMQAHYFVSLVGKIDKEKKNKIEEEKEEWLKFEELFNNFGLVKK